MSNSCRRELLVELLELLGRVGRRPLELAPGLFEIADRALGVGELIPLVSDFGRLIWYRAGSFRRVVAEEVAGGSWS
jgi:hypothetical protein